MKTVTTTAPIPIDLLREHWEEENVTYIIDVANSAFKGDKLLTYISNLDISIDISVDYDSDDGMDILKSYFNTTSMCSVLSLEKIALECLYRRRLGQDNKFTAANQEIVDRWLVYTDSLSVYNLFVFKDEKIQELARAAPVYHLETVIGINFVNLLKFREYYDLMPLGKLENHVFIPKIFEEPIFKRESLFKYWAVPHNPLFALTAAIGDGLITPDILNKLLNEELSIINTSLQEGT